MVSMDQIPSTDLPNQSIEMGSAQDFAFGWEPWTAPALEDLLPQLSREEQLRVHGYLRDHQRISKEFPRSEPSEVERDFIIICHVRYALHHYNAKHPGQEFDAVKPLMESSASFRGQMWYHVNFWARCRKTKNIKRFFAEVHYKLKPFSSTLCPVAEKPQSSNSSVCSDLPPPVPGDEELPSSSSLCSQFPVLIPTVEACTIIEPLGQYWKSCSFCRGHSDILHPKGHKFVCGNDKDMMVQRIKPCGRTPMRLKMPFTCHQAQTLTMGMSRNKTRGSGPFDAGEEEVEIDCCEQSTCGDSRNRVGVLKFSH